MLSVKKNGAKSRNMIISCLIGITAFVLGLQLHSYYETLYNTGRRLQVDLVLLPPQNGGQSASGQARFRVQLKLEDDTDELEDDLQASQIAKLINNISQYYEVAVSKLNQEHLQHKQSNAISDKSLQEVARTKDSFFKSGNTNPGNPSNKYLNKDSIWYMLNNADKVLQFIRNIQDNGDLDKTDSHVLQNVPEESKKYSAGEMKLTVSQKQTFSIMNLLKKCYFHDAASSFKSATVLLLLLSLWITHLKKSNGELFDSIFQYCLVSLTELVTDIMDEDDDLINAFEKCYQVTDDYLRKLAIEISEFQEETYLMHEHMEEQTMKLILENNYKSKSILQEINLSQHKITEILNEEEISTNFLMKELQKLESLMMIINGTITNEQQLMLPTLRKVASFLAKNEHSKPWSDQLLVLVNQLKMKGEQDNFKKCAMLYPDYFHYLSSTESCTSILNGNDVRLDEVNTMKMLRGGKWFLKMDEGVIELFSRNLRIESDATDSSAGSESVSDSIIQISNI